jgi:hypothetical protein
MESLGEIAGGLAANPLAWVATIAIAACAWLGKTLYNTLREDAKDHRETLMKVVPLAEKLTDSVEILERVSNALMEKSK